MLLSRKAAITALFMLALALCAFFAPPALAVDYTVQSVPNVQLENGLEHVSNPDGIISADDVREINRLAVQLRERKGVELAVVAVKSIGTEDSREFANELFSHWGLGRKGEDDGLLILLVSEPPRSVVFETGYGLEGVLPDVVCYRIQQDYMLDDFREGRFGPGLIKGVKALHDLLLGEALPDIAPPVARRVLEPSGAASWQSFAVPFAVLFVYAVVLITKKPYFLYIVFLYTLKLLGKIIVMFLKAGVNNRRGGGRGGLGGGGSRGGSSRSSSRSGGSRSRGGSWGGGRSGGGGSRSRF